MGNDKPKFGIVTYHRGKGEWCIGINISHIKWSQETYLMLYLFRFVICIGKIAKYLD